MQQPRPHPVTVHEKREIALVASVDPRSVDRALRGETVRGLAGERIAKALEARGLTPPR